MRSPRTATESSPHPTQLEKARRSNEDPTQPKIDKLKKKLHEGRKEGRSPVDSFIFYIKKLVLTYFNDL